MGKAKQVAFAASDADLSGGTVSVGDGKTFDVADALKQGNGTILVEEGSLEELALDSYPGLKRSSVPDKRSGAEKE